MVRFFFNYIKPNLNNLNNRLLETQEGGTSLLLEKILTLLYFCNRAAESQRGTHVHASFSLCVYVEEWCTEVLVSRLPYTQVSSNNGLLVIRGSNIICKLPGKDAANSAPGRTLTSLRSYFRVLMLMTGNKAIVESVFQQGCRYSRA